MLLHAPWAGRAWLQGAAVLDGFAGSGAMGLEALSRGAGFCTFIEQDRAALAAIAGNIALLDAAKQTRVIAADMRRPPPGTPQALIFLDAPYGKDLLPASLVALRATAWLAPGSLVVAELGRLDSVPNRESLLTNKVYGAARVVAWREI